MISSIKVIHGYAKELLKERTFNFTRGLNILSGPNGCGKSTILAILAGYTASYPGGWTSIQNLNGIIDLTTEGKFLTIPDSLKFKESKAEIEWDGSSCYYADTAVTDQKINVFGMTGMSFGEEINELFSKPSEGQKRLQRIDKLTKELDKIPELELPKRANQFATAVFNYIKGLPKTGPNTLLLDEPDRNLSIPNQIILWSGYKNLAKKFQMIVASHSFVPFLADIGANFVDIKKGYTDLTREIIEAYKVTDIPKILELYYK